MTGREEDCVWPLLRAVPVIAGVSDALSEATRLGLGEPVAISAETGHCQWLPGNALQYSHIPSGDNATPTVVAGPAGVKLFAYDR